MCEIPEFVGSQSVRGPRVMEIPVFGRSPSVGGP